ncbi:MAG: nitric-oxide reductase large subunit [Planctomycetes bacterium]|nr:nitric-oxide reductase large subunit [Planctomycetota bacterium]
MVFTEKRLWLVLALVVGLGFLLLGFGGREIYRQAPPLPEHVVTESGRELMTRAKILDGQNVWQSIGGQQIGSVWGHGAYQAPDWSADWLHREATALLEHWSRAEHGVAAAELGVDARGALEARLKREMRTNRYDASSGTLVVSDARAQALASTAQHYQQLFGGDEALAELREAYALHDDAVVDPRQLEALSAFFFWSSWACTTERPGVAYTYTNNWPHEPLVGNEPTSSNVLWSVVSIFALLAGIAGMAWFVAARRAGESEPVAPARDPLAALELTPSMRAVGKYLAVVIALFVVQVVLGAVTAHYTVEGQGFFGFPLSKWLPYAVTRTWHIQTGVFWIATAFLATGLFFAPVIGGREPAGQRLGVHLLLGALFLVVGGSLTGEYLSVARVIDGEASFWFGHQGYEYVELGRVWQIALYGGLLGWLFLMLRALWPALRRGAEQRSLLALFTASVVAIGLFYGAGLLYGARTHLSVAEYWRWWVVHLWVEGFFEVFATGALAFLFTRLGLVRLQSATRAFLASTAVFLIGGIPGTFHHLYFSGSPISVTALGATFSALEVVPLVLIGYEALHTLRMQQRAAWMERYRWPIRFFVGVAFWNLVGAGLFGFLINPPIALYYMQGLNTTPVHGHTALFGVYGLLSLGLVLVIARKLCGARVWREKHLRLAFWAMNIGLALMVGLSLLPIGLAQVVASVERGMWWARSAEFLQSPTLELLRWLRLVGDSVFLIGVASLAWFMIGLRTGWSLEPESASPPSAPSERGRSRARQELLVGKAN